MAKREADPSTQLNELLTDLEKSKELRRGYVIKGDERYFVEKAVDAIVAKGKELGLDISTHNADPRDPDFNLSALLDDLAGAPMFASGRLVVVRSASKGLAGGKDAPLARAAVNWLADKSQTGALVLAGNSLRADNVVAKAITKADGKTLNCRKLYDSPPAWNPDPRKVEVVTWLRQRAKQLGVNLDADRALYILRAVGNDLFALEGEVEKLQHSGDMNVADVVEYRGSASPFEVAEHLCRGDLAQSLSGIATLFHGGFSAKDGKKVLDAPALTAIFLGSLRKSVTEGERAARALASGANFQAASKLAGVPGYPKARDSFEARMKARPAQDWSRLGRELVKLERRSRSGATVDANDFFQLALSWRARKSPR